LGIVRAGWEWKRCGSRYTISEDGLVATMGGPLPNPHGPGDEDYDEWFVEEPTQLVTCGQPMTEGRHYWEVEFTRLISMRGDVLFGAVRPSQDCEDSGDVRPSSTSLFCIHSGGFAVALRGNGKSGNPYSPGCDGNVSHVDEGAQYIFEQGDRIGCLLDLDAGWLRFYRNGVRMRQEYASGVTGPLLRFLEVTDEGAVWTALPGAEPPVDEARADAASGRD